MKTLLLADEQLATVRDALGDAALLDHSLDYANRIQLAQQAILKAAELDAPLSVTFAGDAWAAFGYCLNWPAKHGYIVQLTTSRGERFKVKLVDAEPHGLWFRRLDPDERPLPHREFAPFAGEDWTIDSVHIY